MTHPDMIAFHELEPLGVVTEICDDGDALIDMTGYTASELVDYVLTKFKALQGSYPPADWPRDFWGTP